MTYETDLTHRINALWRVAQAAHLRGDMAEAAKAYQALVAIDPTNKMVRSKAALMAWHFRRTAQAKHLMADYLSAFPDDGDMWYDFAKFHQDTGLPREAATLYQHALIKKPSVEAMSNLALCWMELGMVAEAERLFDEALAFKAETAEARFNRSFVRLMRGDFGGWEDYEARMQCASFQWSHERMDLVGPEWKGEPLWKGAVLVVYTEQGYGDVIQFARFVPWVREVVGVDVEVRLEVPPLLKRLFESAWPDLDIVGYGFPHAPYDAKVSILSLPAVAQCTVETIPPPVPFDPDETRFDVNALVGDDLRPRVGIVWAGSKLNPTDLRRTMPEQDIRALLKSVPGVRWFSLQVGEREDEFFANGDPELAAGATFLRAGATYRDFHDTAALIKRLDCVVTVCTAAAHLAGSLGVPTLLMSKAPPDFRWMLDRSDSPWYPSMRIVRQATPNDWSGVLDEVASALNAFTASVAA